MKIYSVEDGIQLEIPESLKDQLVDQDLIHFNGTNWLFFDSDYQTIKNQIIL